MEIITYEQHWPRDVAKLLNRDFTQRIRYFVYEFHLEDEIYTGWVICRCTLCCVSKNRNKGLILCTTMCYSCQVAYRSELSQTARISLLVYERNSCRASSFQCIYPCFNKSFINGWVLSETQNGMFTKNAATVLAQFRLNSVWLSKWHTAKHEKENVRLFRKCEKSLKVSASDEMWHDC